MSKWSNRGSKVFAALVGGFRYLPMQGVAGTTIRIPLAAHRGFWPGPMPDADLIAFLAGALPDEGGVFLDVGGNIGTYPAALAAVKQGKLRGAAFEPVPKTNMLLRRTLDLNGLEGFLAEAVALSSREAELRFTAYAGGGNNFIVQRGDPRSQVVAHSTTLDGWVDAHPDLAPDAIKIDVEGHELEVLKGGMKVLARCRPALVLECHCASWLSLGVDAAEVNATLRQCGYAAPVDRSGAPVELLDRRETVHLLCRSSTAA